VQGTEKRVSKTMIKYTPSTPLEVAVLETGRFELTTDTADQEVVVVGQQRMPKVVMPCKSVGIHDLMAAIDTTAKGAFIVNDSDPWEIDVDGDGERETSPTAAEEYLVMGLRPLRSDGRPVRVADRRGVVRLFVLPWMLPAKTVGFGTTTHYVVTSGRNVVGDWDPIDGGRSGVVVGLPETWVGTLERYRRPGSDLVFRCDVPVPWIGDTGLRNCVPTTVGVYDTPTSGDEAETWVARLPVVMTEGDVVQPVAIPANVDVDEIPDGPWELELQGSADFSLGSLT
jgi:hypothetical protein